MHRFELPTDYVEYLDLALPAAGPRLVARWGTQTTPFTVATWDKPGARPSWQFKGDRPDLSPDGEWLSLFDRGAGEVRITRVGANAPAFVVARDMRAENVWTAVAAGGVAVAWKEDARTVVRALPGGEIVASVKSGWGYGLAFSPGGRWLTEFGEGVFRVFDRANGYRVAARVPATRHSMMAEIADGPTAAVVSRDRGAVAVWELPGKSATAELRVGEWVSALAISADGRRVLAGNTDGEVALWDALGTRLQLYDWEVDTPIAATFSRDGMRAAVGGTGGRIVVWDLDD